MNSAFGWLLQVSKRCRRHGAHGQTVETGCAERGHFTRYFFNVMVIDAGHQDRIYFDHHSRFYQSGNAGSLGLQDALTRFASPENLLSILHPLVDFAADFWIYGTHSYCNMADLQVRQGLGIVRQSEAIGGHTQQHFRVSFADETQGLQRCRGLCEGVSGPCNSHYSDRGVPAYDVIHVSGGLLGIE